RHARPGRRLHPQRPGVCADPQFCGARQTFVFAARGRRTRRLRHCEPQGMSAPQYVIRAAGPADIEGFKQLREIAGAGFTSLMLDDAAMMKKLELSQESFASTATEVGAERYFMALEHIETGAVAGCCGVKATIGETPPFFNFRMITEAQSS